jgi:hypothetical protein
MCREPVSQIKDDAGEEARFCDAEQEAHGIEARGAAHHCHGHGKRGPSSPFARNPDAGTEMLEGQVARNLEQKIADE